MRIYSSLLLWWWYHDYELCSQSNILICDDGYIIPWHARSGNTAIGEYLYSFDIKDINSCNPHKFGSPSSYSMRKEEWMWNKDEINILFSYLIFSCWSVIIGSIEEWMWKNNAKYNHSSLHECHIKKYRLQYDICE